MKIKTTFNAIALVCTISGAAFGQTKAPEPDYTLSYNIGATTDYRYRGISQSSVRPAIQGGADLTFKNGAYLGAWASTISWIKNATSPSQAKGPVELDLYGGYKGELSKALSYDVGGLYYFYPGNTLSNISANANTFEVYGALTMGVLTAKYSHSLTNLFGAATATQGSKGSGYFDLSANFDLGNGWSVAPHVGAQTVKNFSSVTDYSLNVNKDFDSLVLSGGLVGTNRSGQFGTEAGSNRDLFKNGLVLSVKKNF